MLFSADETMSITRTITVRWVQSVAITTTLHGLMIALVLLAISASVGSGFFAMRWGTLRKWARTQAALMALLWMGYNAYYFSPSHFDWQVSLPLQVCDLLGPSAAIAVGLRLRTARSFLYFCALPLAGQAVLTPTGNQDPMRLRFWLYWALHAAILALSVSDLTILKFRPLFRDYLTVVLIDFLYAAVIVPVDMVFGWNYGYLGNSVPTTLTMVSFLGPWPRRIVVMLTLVIALQGLLLTPWLLTRRASRIAALRRGGAA
jgi:hypothetical integral membrane protein (TIGR02206 family)